MYAHKTIYSRMLCVYMERYGGKSATFDLIRLIVCVCVVYGERSIFASRLFGCSVFGSSQLFLGSSCQLNAFLESRYAFSRPLCLSSAVFLHLSPTFLSFALFISSLFAQNSGPKIWIISLKMKHFTWCNTRTALFRHFPSHNSNNGCLPNAPKRNIRNRQHTQTHEIQI